MHQIRFQLGLRPDLAGRVYTAPQPPWQDLRVLLLRGGERTGRERTGGEGRGREDKGGQGKGFGREREGREMKGRRGAKGSERGERGRRMGIAHPVFSA